MGQNYPPRFLKQPGGGQHSPATGSKPIRPKTSVPDSPRLPAIIRPAPPSRSQRHAAMGSNSTRATRTTPGSTGHGFQPAQPRTMRPAPRKKTLTLCDNLWLSPFSPAHFPLFSVCLGVVFVLFGFSLFSVHGAELPTTVFETARRRTAFPRHRLPFDPHRRGQYRPAMEREPARPPQIVTVLCVPLFYRGFPRLLFVYPGPVCALFGNGPSHPSHFVTYSSL